MAISITNATAIVAMNAITPRVDAGVAAGVIKIYGSAAPGMPADADVAITTQDLLATLTFQDPAFAGASDDAAGGAIASRAGTIASDVSTIAGTATFFRVEDSAGLTVLQGNITTIAVGTGDMQLDTVTITLGGTLALTAFDLTLPETGA